MYICRIFNKSKIMKNVLDILMVALAVVLLWDEEDKLYTVG